LDQVSERISTLDAAGLKLFQIYLSIDIAPGATPYDARLKDTLPLLKDRNVMIATLMNGLPPSDTAGDARAVAVLREIADQAQPYGVRVALYPHSNAWLERVEDAIRVADQVDRPNVGVMFNLCHWLKVDDEANLEPLLTKAMPRLYAVTINGADHADAIHAGTGNWIQPLDSGTFDLRGLLGLLRERGYTGPVGLQCYGLPGDAREHLTRSIAAWRALNEPR
jgi:sugar phosphate isomerase/epimerase